eukprot:6134782-Prymnesium_polylepis.1
MGARACVCGHRASQVEQELTEPKPAGPEDEPLTEDAEADDPSTVVGSEVELQAAAEPAAGAGVGT